MAKQATNQTANLAIMTKKRLDGWQQMPIPKVNKKYFNYGKKGYYAKNCYLHMKRKSKDKKTAKEARQVC